MTAKGNGDVVVQLRDGKETLRLDFNAIELVEERLGCSVLDFFIDLQQADDKEAQRKQSRRLLDAALLRRIFYAGMLWKVPEGEEPSFTEQDVGRRMELSRLAEYVEQSVALLGGAFGVGDDKKAVRDALPKSRSTKRKRPSGAPRRNPT